MTFFELMKPFGEKIIFGIMEHKSPGLTLLLLEHRPLQRQREIRSGEAWRGQVALMGALELPKERLEWPQWTETRTDVEMVVEHPPLFVCHSSKYSEMWANAMTQNAHFSFSAGYPFRLNKVRWPSQLDSTLWWVTRCLPLKHCVTGTLLWEWPTFWKQIFWRR